MPDPDHSRKARILVVDDEKGFTHMLKMALSSNYDICEVNDPDNALGAARDFHPDLILLDVVMPTLDGGDLAAQFRADPSLANVPVVFLTAIVSPTEGETERVINGYPFIAKPVSRDAVIRCIESHLDQAARA
jgi:CheY-like chemotaxis protein